MTKTPEDLYEEWNAKMIKAFPRDRLLLLNAKQGWTPLAQHLGFPDPSLAGVPYPHAEEDNFNAMIGAVLYAGALVWPFVLVALVVAALWVAEQTMRVLRLVASGVLPPAHRTQKGVKVAP